MSADKKKTWVSPPRRRDWVAVKRPKVWTFKKPTVNAEGSGNQ